MKRWIDYSLDERKAMIQGVVNTYHIDETAAEKDWWVTVVLYALFHTSVAKYLLFKGGTSLSKGWNIINRFSEDIDLALDRDFFIKEKQLSYAKCTSNTQIHHFREKAQDYFFREFKEELKMQMSALGLQVKVLAENESEDGRPVHVDHDKDPSLIYIQYPSIYNNHATYATPTIKIEISVLSMAEPYEMKRISSLVGNVYEEEGIDADLAQDIRTASPTRTFLEKAFLMCEEYQKPSPRTFRMTRHFYDMEKLMQTPYVEKALNDFQLYKDIVNHRKKFYHVGAVDYNKELPDAITIVPPSHLIAAFEADYATMRQSFIYGESLDFETLMQRLNTLQNQFREIQML